MPDPVAAMATGAMDSGPSTTWAGSEFADRASPGLAGADGGETVKDG